jgi:deoxyguanosine kinase
MTTPPSYRALPCPRGGRYTRGRLDYRYVAIEGPVGVGKTALAERLALRLDATAILEDADNPFLADFYQDRPGSAFQAQLFFLLNRHRQLSGFRQTDLFSQVSICDYVFDRDRIYAYLSLDDAELFIYQRLYDLLVRDIPAPDLVVYLQAPTELLLKRLRDRARDPDQQTHRLDSEYVKELNEAYQHFFFHYTATPLLIVETSQIDFGRSDDAVDDLLRQLRTMGRGTQYYVPR